MNNIVLFRGRPFATQFSALHILPVKNSARSMERTVSIPRPRLMAVWHVSARTGKLECFWTTENGPVLDEDGSYRAA